MNREQRDETLVDEMRRHELEIAAVLNPTQRTRFAQIALQSRGALAFREAGVSESLKLNQVQRERLRLLENDFGPPPGEGFHGGPPHGIGPEPTEKMEKALAVLTPEQLKLWQAMIGPSFNGFRKGGPRPFGPPPGGPRDHGPRD